MTNQLPYHLPHVRGEYRFRFSLAPLTWFKVGGLSEVFYRPVDLKDLQYFLQNLDPMVPIFVIGAGSNLLIRDGGMDGIVIKLNKSFANIDIQDQYLTVGAGCLNYNLALYCVEHQITGFEFLSGIPGTIGGGIAMNAGAYGSEFKDSIVSIRALDRDGNIVSYTNHEIGFGYRKNSLPDNLIFIDATFKYQKGSIVEINKRMLNIENARKATQPIYEKTCGSTFANPVGYSAWKLINDANIRHHVVGNARISEKHCNFLINKGSASAQDLEDLGEFIRNEVYRQFNIRLQWEIKRIGKYLPQQS